MRAFFSTFHAKNNILTKLPNPKSFTNICNFLTNHVTWNLMKKSDLNTRDGMKKFLNVSACTLYDNQDQLQSNFLATAKLFYMCNDLKYSRARLHGILVGSVEKNIDQMHPILLVKIYEYFITLWQFEEPLLKNMRTKSFDFFTTQPQKEENLFFLILFMQLITLDRGIPPQQKYALINSLKFPFKTFLEQNINRIKQNPNTYVQIIFLYDMFRTYKVQMDPDLHEELQNFYQSFESSFREDQMPGNNNRLQMGHKSIYFQSKFERIFERTLMLMGYDYEKNLIIKCNEYDFLIKNIVKVKNMPFHNIDIFSNQSDPASEPRIPLSLVHNISRSENVEFYHEKRALSPTIINLNGPFHYIDTDMEIKEPITPQEMFRYHKLPLYGINRYSIVNYQQWEEINKFTGQAHKFVHDLVDKPIILA